MESGDQKGLVGQLGRIFGLKEHQTQKLHQLLVLGLIGVLILLAADVITPEVINTSAGNKIQSQPGPENQAVGERDDLRAWEGRISRELSAVLTHLQGAGQVHVWVKLKSGPEQSMVQNTNATTRRTAERDSSGAVRETTEENRSSQPVMARGDDRALVRQVISPEVSNVLVVADGARYPEVRARIVRAIQGALGIPLHRIQVSPMEGR